MEYLVTAKEMKEYDANTMEIIGVPGMVLMERAALAAFAVIEERFGASDKADTRVLILAGMGNNGGDGLALARLLSDAGYQVSVQYVGNPENATEQWKLQKKILEHYTVGTGSKKDGMEYTIMVDALFGVGLSRNIEGDYAQAVADFNQAKAFKLALDIPSGIHADAGRVLGCAVCADVTVTFGFCKRGLMLFPGNFHAGEIITAPIGINEKSFLDRKPGMFYYKEDIAELLPKRDRSGNKGTFGKVLLIAGSPKMAGAAILSAKAAYRSGAGMVKVITHADNRMLLQSAVPEALFGTYDDVQDSLQWADVIAIGPGLGKDETAAKLLKEVICESSLPLLIDADGLNLLAEQKALMAELRKQGIAGRQLILTPHVGELSRLTGRSVAELKEALLELADVFAKQQQVTLVAKDARTFTCGAGEAICVNVHGNSGMATAGSGDVLAGIIAGLWAQGMETFAAASVGVYLHALAGDKVSAEMGEHPCMAGDLIRSI